MPIPCLLPEGWSPFLSGKRELATSVLSWRCDMRTRVLAIPPRTGGVYNVGILYLLAPLSRLRELPNPLPPHPRNIVAVSLDAHNGCARRNWGLRVESISDCGAPVWHTAVFVAGVVAVLSGGLAYWSRMDLERIITWRRTSSQDLTPCE
ncbi:hypothetical protein BD779DRAFT_814122 [Infundibulicybe gibba]|nr:hypothetical protein BD779DRAFT_814122 [Infundibulicybe gibba]